MSNKAIDIIYAAKQEGIDIALNGEELHLKLPKNRSINKELVNDIRSNKQLLVDFLKDNTRGSSDYNTIERFNRDEIKKIPASFSQQRLWIIDQFEGSVHYHIPTVLRLRGKLQVEAVEFAIQTIIDRHEILRTVIEIDENEVYQKVIHNAKDWKLDLIEDVATKDEAVLKQLIQEFIAKPFNLSEDFMLRAALIFLDKEEYVLVINMHHIVGDAWSSSIFVKEMVELYVAFTEQREPALAPLPIQFADYAVWQRNLLQGEVLQKMLGYWQNKLAGVSPLVLPADHSITNTQTNRGATINIDINHDLYEKLKWLSQSQGVTLFMTLLASFKVLLHNYSGQNDICVGTPIAGRQQRELDGMIGFFINALALRSDVDAKVSFTDFLQQVKTTTLEAYQHQEVPFEKVVDAVSTTREFVRNPVFNVLFSLQNTPDAPGVNIKELTLSAEETDHNTAKVDVTLSFKETSNGLQGALQYSTDLYSRTTAERMITHFKELLQSIVAAPDKKIGKLQMLSQDEQHQLLFDFNNTKADYPKDKTIVSLFEEQVKSTPNATAVVFEGKQLSYQQLNEKANQIAHFLQKKGVQSQALVPVCIERSLEMIIGLLGILKAGAAYVPIDPEYPSDRINYIVNNCGASILLAGKNASAALTTEKKVEIVTLDVESSFLNEFSTENLPDTVLPNHLAYVIYTSGSTGEPKGVMIEHSSYINLHYSYHKIAPGEQTILTCNYVFDVSVLEIFSSLLSGGCLHIPVHSVTTDPFAFARFLFENSISTAYIHPMFLSDVASVLGGYKKLFLRKILIGVEPIRKGDVQWYIDNGANIINGYGPTETTVCASFYHVDNSLSAHAILPIGKPVPNNKIYILTGDSAVAPIGVLGELIIGGAGLGRGYLNNTELTAEKFVQNPVLKDGEKVYKTGDVARWLPDGNIEFAGRLDAQVKIRGYRIELGEIESVVLQSGLVKNVVVLAKEDAKAVKRLVAYVVPEQTFEKSAIKAFLKSKVPDYMLPTLWVELAILPVTSNGKIDRKALPEPDFSAIKEHEFVAPSTETEKILATSWEDLLGLKSVGIHDNFFELGGNSLVAIRMISALRSQLNIDIPISTVFKFPTIAELSLQLQSLEQNNESKHIDVQVKREFIPLSYNQQSLWFIDKMEGSVPYNIPSIFKLKGSLDIASLQFALQTIVNRHEVLRTVYKEHFGEAYQYILPSDQFRLKVLDGSQFNHDSNGLQQYINEIITAPFDLSRDHMLRAQIINLGEEEHLLVVTMHHIASDGWSLSIIVKEVVELYEAHIQNRPHELAALPIQYADFAIWQRAHLSGEQFDEKLNYWKNKLEGVESLHFPTDYPRPANWSSRGAIRSFSIDKDLSDKLQQFSRQQGATLYMTLLAALKVLLFRYTGQEDFCVGTSVAGRQQKEVENLVGFFINIIAFRNEVNSNHTFKKFLHNVKTTTLEAFENQEVPFEKVVDAVVKDRGTTRHPITQVMLVLQNTPEVSALKFGDVELSRGVYEQTTSQHDFIFRLVETAAGIKGTIEFATDLYSETSMLKLVDHYKQLLSTVLTFADTRIGDLPILNAAEEKQLLLDFNDTKVDFPSEKAITDLFEEHAQNNPGYTAIEFGNEEISYGELNERANKLANYLLSLGVTKESLVPVCIERSVEMIVCILGILKTGAAYIPIDPDYPEERINFMIEDSGAKLVVSSKKSASKLPPAYDFEVVEVDSENKEISTFSSENLLLNIAPNNLAYVIYTSGSTGKPKGVLVEHKGVVNLATSQAKVLGLGADVRNLQFASFGFDASVYEIFSTVLSGACLVLCTKEDILSPELFKELITNHNVEVVTLPPSYQRAITNGFGNLKTIVSAGEPLNEAVGKFIQENGVRLINAYGPTENTVCVTLTDDPIKPNHTITIGKPLDNVQVYILDKENKLLPVGSVGEICVGGAQVARGYLNRDELTAEKFIKDPFSNEASARLYKTGDLGRWRPDGEIEYAGRIDDQLKLRGYRIEPGEIENVLQQHEAISEAVVLPQPDKEGNVRLVAYVITTDDYDKQEVIQFLESRLPDYMVPSIVVELETFPVTSSGKIDKKALPNPDANELLQNEFIAPRNEVEQRLADIWLDLLAIEKVGITDNFFELGGHSLLAVRMISAIRKEFDVEIEIGEIFDYPTIAQLAEQLPLQHEESLIPVIQKQSRPAFIPLSFSQERLWFIDQLEGSLQYHIPVILKLNGTLDQNALKSALQTIVNRHEVLRTVIRQHEAQGYQFILGENELEVPVTDGLKYASDEQGLQQHIQQLITRPFDLANDHMLRANLVDLGNDKYVLITTMHHIASDGWSTSILVKELIELYAAFAEKRPFNLAPLPLQYADYAIWQKNYLQGELLDKKLAYWKEKLSSVEPLRLPTDFARPAVQTTNGAYEVFSLAKDSSDKLQALSQQNGATLFMTLLAAFKVLLYRYSGQRDVCIGTPIAGRQQHELESLIGFFLNTLALRTELAADASFAELLSNVKTTTLEAYQHQDVPFEKVVDAVVQERDMSRTPLFQAMFVLQNTPEVPELVLGELKLNTLKTDNHTARFDITVSITENRNGLDGSFQYNTDLYTSNTVKRMIGNFKELLSSIIADPAKKIAELPMLTAEEKHQLLFDFNKTDAAYPKDQTIVDLFDTQVQKTPDAVAVVFEEEQLTYEELNKKANQLAHFLLKKGLQKEALVPICIERGLEMIVGLLGILKAGGAYVPIDPEYPAERISYMLEDTGASLVVSSTSSRIKISNADKLEVIEIDGEAEIFATYPTTNPVGTCTPDSLAYVIYTSGSTGKPKGVMIEHSSYINLHYSYHKIASGEQTVLTCNYVFDVSVLEIFSSLLQGGCLNIPHLSITTDPFEFAHFLHEKRISTAYIHPMFLTIVGELLSKHEECFLTKILIGVEPIRKGDIEWFLDKNINIINGYGPTETTICATFYRLDNTLNAKSVLPIGRPVPNNKIYIVTSDSAIAPIGVSGEILIGGPGVGRGYLNNSKLTSEKFVQNPIEVNEQRVYKTGDIGRWLADGNIEYLGRIDDQVKIRGFRIELGEIESVLLQSGLVKQAVVVAKEDKEGNKRLVGYVVADGEIDRAAIQSNIKTKLPDYMVPAIFVQLESLPLTPNGKIDKKALPDPDINELLSEQYVAPRNEFEQQLADIWQQLLKVERVGIHDNFFALGGHSLLAMQVISAIRQKLQVEVSIKDLFLHPSIAELSAQLQSNKENVLLPTIIKQERPEFIPLSFSQERLWFIDQLEGSTQYHIPSVFRMTGSLVVDALQFALQTVVDRHEVLRTVIRSNEGEGYQHILPAGGFVMEVFDRVRHENSLSELQQFIQQLVIRPFDLGSDHMLRADLIKVAEDEYIMVVTMHHIASDGWSISILVKEIVAVYSTFLQKKPLQLSPLPIQYADYSLWQRNYLKGDLLDKKLDYWKKKLRGFSPLQLPVDYPRAAVQSIKGDVANFTLPKGLTNQLSDLGKKQGATLFMTLLAAFKVLLSRYSRQEDIIVGTPVANRPTHELEGLIGFFINTLALRTIVEGDMPFTAVLQEVKTTTLEAFEHQDVPFEKVVDLVVKDRNVSRNPLIQVMFILQNTPEVPRLSFGEVTLSPEKSAHNTSMFDLTFYITETAEGAKCTVEYSTELYKKETVEHLIGNYKQLLSSIVETPEQQVSGLRILTEEEEHQLLVEFNNTDVDFPLDKTIAGLFEEQVQKTPEKVALVFGEQEVTYKDLNGYANALANHLQSIGVKQQSLVPLCIERNIELVVSILAILKLGAVYVPIDADYPVERIKYVLEDTGAALVVTNKALAGKLESIAAIKMVFSDDFTANDQFSENSPKVPFSAENLVSIVYTSGSTGKPKGVNLKQKGVVNRMYWMWKEYPFEENEVCAIKTSIGFVDHVWELLGPLTKGVKCVIFSREDVLNLDSLVTKLSNEKITRWVLVPSLLRALVDKLQAEETTLPYLKYWTSSGETLRKDLVDDFYQVFPPAAHKLLNIYGSSEVTADVTFYDTNDSINNSPTNEGTAGNEKENDHVPIGKPLANCKVYIVDKNGRLVPQGVWGEMLIGGVQVAGGYFNAPELTAAKFKADFFSKKPGATLFSTGDIGRWLADGNIEYQGRKDGQVKIRGFRIEPGEVENILLQSELVTEAVVLAKEDNSGNNQLIGYVVAADFNKESVSNYLKSKLPDYMVPAIWVELEKMPLLPNGKINKRALPHPDVSALLSHQYVAPVTDTEKKLAVVWQALLGIERAGINDNFFELGGHSILIMKMVSSIKKSFGLTIPIQVVFQLPTIKGLSNYLDWEHNIEQDEDASEIEVINL